MTHTDVVSDYTEILSDPIFTPALVEQIIKVEQHQVLTNDFVRKVIRGVHKHAILAGPPGLGKSYSVSEALKTRGLVENEDYIILKGHLTNSQLYAVLYLYRQKGQFVVLDDCDDVLNNEVGLGIIKSATDPDSGRVCWHSPNGIGINGQVVREFHFKGTMIICSNVKMTSGREGRRNDHVSAITSRATLWPLGWQTKEQKFAQIFNLVVNHDYLGARPETTLTTDQKRDLLKFILENLNDIRNMDLRLPQKLAREINDGGNWRKACQPFLGA
jgi:hypothetical protein